MKLLKHPNVARCVELIDLDSGGGGEAFYIVMEFCNAGSLDGARAAFPDSKVPLVILAGWARQLMAGDDLIVHAFSPAVAC